MFEDNFIHADLHGGNVLERDAPEAPGNITGIKHVDQAQCIQLAEQARSLALGTLKQNGRFVVKIFEGELAKEFRESTKALFAQAFVRKPGASRSVSSEIYIVALRPKDVF